MRNEFPPDPRPAPAHEASAEFAAASAKTVFVKHKGGAGGVVHEYGWDFNASDTIEADRAVAEGAVAKYPEVFEIVPAPVAGK